MARGVALGAAATVRARPARLDRYLGRGVVYALLLAALVVAGVPFLWSILASLKTTFEIFESPFALPRVVRWDNYVVAWTQGHFGTYFFNSVAIVIPTVALTLAFGSLAGLALARLRFPGSSALFYAFLVGLGVPGNALVVPLFFTVKELGLLNSFLGVILPSVGSNMPFAILLMRAFFRSLPRELEDAARIDGCNSVRVYWHVMLPLSTGALLSLLIFTFMDSWNGFLYPLMFLQEEQMRTIPLGLLVFQGRHLSEFAVLFAALVISFIPTLILYFTFQRHFVQGITLGSIRG